ncbi:NlpC/P60 family protein [Ewingella americana]|uniref:NlpC/P60 family protein n=1 Tax=Ewingella americana TaxID=41202 RepID=UPI00189CC4CB|nr:NlpC/P60 family protein [Ewingella americana]
METEATWRDHNEVRERILTEFYQWEGVKYKLGGVNDAGIDCSALMQEIFIGALEMELPRTTSEQIKKGRSVSISQLKPGDLVFFHTKKTVRHVGVYVGKKKFVHASSSKGVTVSSLDNSYWIEHFEAARRVLS